MTENPTATSEDRVGDTALGPLRRGIGSWVPTAVLIAAWLAAFSVRFIAMPEPVPNSEEQAVVYPGLTTASLDHLASVVQAAVLLLAAMSLGAWCLRRLRVGLDDALSLSAFGAGLGLGIFSLMGLGLGVIGVLEPAVFLLIPVAALALGGRDLSRLLSAWWRRLSGAVGVFSSYRVFIWTVPVFLLLLHLSWAFVPPTEYDVLEYHLAGPKAYWQSGRVFFIDSNVYTAFPGNVEMLYMWAFVLKGKLFAGAYLAQVLNVLLGVWAAGAVACAAGRLFGPAAAGAAGILFYVLPWTSELSRPAYVELALTGYAVLAAVAFIEYIRRPQRRWVMLAGCLGGLAMGCKYPAALFCILPLLAGVLLVNRDDRRRALRHAGVAAVLALAAVSPWLLRNVINTGNPVYPLLGSVFDADAMTPALAAKFGAAHQPGSYSPADLSKATLRFFTQGDIAGKTPPILRALAYLPVCLLALWAVVRRRDKGVLVAGCGIVLAWILWLLFTHRIGRFLVPWTSLAASLATGGLWVVPRVFIRRALLLAAMLLPVAADVPRVASSQVVKMALRGADGAATMRILTERTTSPYEAIEKVNELGPESRTLFVGEAQTLYCTGDVVAPTVFNRHPLEEILAANASPDEILDNLREKGITHIYVNLDEFKRLHSSYRYHFQGRQRPGLWDLTPEQWRTFDGFLHRRTKLVHACGGPVVLDDIPPGERINLLRFTPTGSAGEYVPLSQFIYRLADEKSTGDSQ